MTEYQFSSSWKEKLERLKNEVAQISTDIKKWSYKTPDELKMMSKKKNDLENEIFILEL